MALRTALVIDGNSESGKKALADLDAAIGRSEKEARQLAAAYSAADIATTKLAQAQAAAKAANDATRASFAAGEITLEEYERQLLETRTALGLVQAEHRETVGSLRNAQAAYDAATGRGQQFVRSLGEQRIGAQQLAMNINDMATMFALGARPQQIFASQGGQVVQALALMSGGAKGVLGLLGNPWVFTITTAGVALLPLIGNLFDAKEAAEDAEDALAALERAAGTLGRSQSMLANFIDLATGKQLTQNEATREAIRLQAELTRIEAVRAGREAGRRLQALRPELEVDRGAQGMFTAARVPGITALPSGASADARARFDEAVRSFLRDPNASVTQFRRAIETIPGVDVNAAMQQAVLLAASRNEARDMRDIQAVADGAALPDRFLKPDKSSTRSRSSGKTAAEIALQHADAMSRLHQEELQAQIALTTDVRDRADLEQQLLREEFEQRAAQIRNDKEYTAAQKEAQIKALERLYGVVKTGPDGTLTLSAPGLLQQQVALERDIQLERERMDLAETQHQVAREALQAQLALADTDARRKSLALQIFDAEEAYLRAKLEAVIASETAADAEKRNAAILLEGLRGSAAARREAAERGNATAVERYLRSLRQTPEQINEAIDRIKIDGLESLTAELRNAATEALGLHGVLGNIIGDLIEIGIRRRFTLPFANALFGAEGDSGGGGLLGSMLGALFGGGRAEGGPVSPGKFYAVNERSTAPGLFIPLMPGRIEPPGNDNGASGGRPIVEVRLFAGEMFDARVQRISGDVAVSVVDARTPAVVGAAVNETARQLTRARI